MATKTKQALLDHVEGEIARLKEEMGEDEGDAFCHFVLQTLFGLDDDDAAEACSFAVTESKRPDAFWYDREGGRVVLIETRYLPNGKARVDPRQIMELTRAWSSLDPGCVDAHAPTLAETAAAFEQARELNDGVTVELLYAVTGSFVDSAHKYAQDFNEDHKNKRISLRLVDIEELADADFERRSREAPPLKESITLQLRQSFEETSEDGGAPTLVASIDGAQLARIEQEYRYSIFERNVRYQIPGKINKNIENTLKRAEGRRNFWYYNNGISIICDAYELDEKRKSVRVKNLQIVNGCQTTTTLGANLDELTNPAPLVLVRIIASADEDLQRAVTLYNNRQNAVRDRDLLSTDQVQESLQAAFDELDPPWFYERKRGAWKAEVAPSAKAKKRYGTRIVNNEKAAQAAYAFHHDPGEARARKRMLFVTRRDDQGGFYERLFNSSTTPQWLLVPFLVGQYVAKRKSEYTREARKAEELAPEEISVAEKKLLQRSWIKFADQAIIGSIALYLSKRMELSDENLKRLLEGEILTELLPASYSLALRDLAQFFQSKAREASKLERAFVPANYLKGNWTSIREWLESQELFREEVEEDPFRQYALPAREPA
jgi:hypothetical protein